MKASSASAHAAHLHVSLRSAPSSLHGRAESGLSILSTMRPARDTKRKGKAGAGGGGGLHGGLPDERGDAARLEDGVLVGGALKRQLAERHRRDAHDVGVQRAREQRHEGLDAARRSDLRARQPRREQHSTTEVPRRAALRSARRGRQREHAV